MSPLRFASMPTRVAALATVGLFILVACGGGRAATDQIATPSVPPSGQTAPPASGATVDVKMLPDFRFDESELIIPADTYVTVIVDNTADGIPHDFAVYRSKADADANAPALARTSICAGPCKEVLNLRLAPGEYFFRCDVYPGLMYGTLIASESAGSH